jgi:hypothetical protein
VFFVRAWKKKPEMNARFESVLRLCETISGRNNATARYLGMPDYNPAEPRDLEEALQLLEDLEYLRFDLQLRVEHRNQIEHEVTRLLYSERIRALEEAGYCTCCAPADFFAA